MRVTERMRASQFQSHVFAYPPIMAEKRLGMVELLRDGEPCRWLSLPGIGWFRVGIQRIGRPGDTGGDVP